jgi:hypothetical protein
MEKVLAIKSWMKVVTDEEVAKLEERRAQYSVTKSLSDRVTQCQCGSALSGECEECDGQEAWEAEFAERTSY